MKHLVRDLTKMIMNYSVYIRRLVLDDAKVSYKWRNNPDIWKYTAFKADKHITHKIEAKWLANILTKEDEVRFAICLKRNDQYIGNVHLTNIKANSAYFHLVIGENRFWGKGIGKEATALILNYAFSEIHLDRIFLTVDPTNLSALSIYKKLGFIEISGIGKFVKMKLTRRMYEKGSLFD